MSYAPLSSAIVTVRPIRLSLVLPGAMDGRFIRWRGAVFAVDVHGFRERMSLQLRVCHRFWPCSSTSD